MIKLILKKGDQIILTNPIKAASILNVHVETVRGWYRNKKKVLKQGFEVYTVIKEMNKIKQMSDSKFPTKEQYKELDELMTYILDEMWGTDDKQLIREGIIAYANKWHETQEQG